jgi:excisionase family DNA binding protein
LSDVNRLLTVDDVAKIFGIPVRGVYDLVESRDPANRLPHVKIGRRVRFLSDQVFEYVCQRAS